MKRNQIPSLITECTGCGWTGSYDPDCDCVDCNDESEMHLAQHFNRKPNLIARPSAQDSIQMRSPLADIIEMAG